jgi:uncharacterized protein (DUF433 family)
MKTNVINIDPEILGGTPVFMGTRVPIKILFDYIEGGETLEEFLDGFPSVTREQALEVLNIAESFVTSSEFVHAGSP